MKLKNLFILGDIGYFNQNLYLAVNSIKNKLTCSDSITLLGDNFYPYGINDKNDEKINSFQNIFKDINNPIYSILGNHDYLLNPKAQINNTNWIMNDFYFKQEYDNVELYFIDTVQFHIHTWVSKDKIEKVHNKKINLLVKDQINWLENEMSKNNKDKIVIGHYPILTNGYYFGIMNKLYRKLINIFKKYEIKAYISGHEHNIQHIKRKKNNYMFNQIIIGSSAENRDNTDNSKDRDMFDKSDIFYGMLRFEDNEMIIDYVNKNGIVKYSYNL